MELLHTIQGADVPLTTASFRARFWARGVCVVFDAMRAMRSNIGEGSALRPPRAPPSTTRDWSQFVGRPIRGSPRIEVRGSPRNRHPRLATRAAYSLATAPSRLFRASADSDPTQSSTLLSPPTDRATESAISARPSPRRTRRTDDPFAGCDRAARIAETEGDRR